MVLVTKWLAARTLHLAADPRRRGAFDVRRNLRCCSTGLSGRACHRKPVKQSRWRDVRSSILLENSTNHKYHMIMAIRPEALPTDPAASDRDGARARRREREAAGGDADAQGDGVRQALGAARCGCSRAARARAGDLATGVTPPAPPTTIMCQASQAGTSGSPARRPGATSARCPSICRAASRCSSRRRPRVRAARAGCTRSARTSARCWTSSRRSCGCCARSVPNMPAAAAPTAWCRRRCCRG